jgi:hypothetical protein
MQFPAIRKWCTTTDRIRILNFSVPLPRMRYRHLLSRHITPTQYLDNLYRIVRQRKTNESLWLGQQKGNRLSVISFGKDQREVGARTFEMGFDEGTGSLTEENKLLVSVYLDWTDCKVISSFLVAQSILQHRRRQSRGFQKHWCFHGPLFQFPYSNEPYSV